VKARGWLAPLLLALAGCALVASTWRVFGHIWDEPEHIAAGLVLLDRGEYVYDNQHPPLARLAAAIGPYLAGARSHGSTPPSGEEEGRQILYHSSASYDTLLWLARAGMLPFFIILVLATWLRAERWMGRPAAWLSCLFLLTTPTVLGHAGVAALDIPVTALCILSLYWLLRWVEAPTTANGVWVGISVGLAFSTKLSAVPFLALGGTGMLLSQTLISRQPRLLPWGRYALTAAIALALILVIAIGIYGPRMIYLTTPSLTPNKALDLLVGQSGALHDAAYRLAARVRVPLGVEMVPMSLLGVEWHNTVGHLSFLLGETRRTGWWYFYLVALAVKTPLPLLLLGLPGLVLLARDGWRERRLPLLAVPVTFAAILTFCCIESHINIGVRHVLVLYPLLALAAAWTVLRAWRAARQRPALRAAVAALTLWQCATVVYAYPDYLPYFNAIAGNHPERILVDSDLDWGQDLRRLSQALAQRHVPEVSIAYLGTADLTREHLPPFHLLKPGEHVTGWVAIDMLSMKEERDGYSWLTQYTPVTRVGKSIDLYEIPIPQGPGP
jgi:4-amino-4-deoxy-L-arabinose transferase-like glycosyltransferase